MKKLFLKSSVFALLLGTVANPVAFALTSTSDTADVVPANYGYIDISESTNAPNFQDGLILAYRNGKYGYIDTTGKEITEFMYSDAMPFKNGYAPVYVDGLWGIINKNGAYVSVPKYYSLTSTSLGDYMVTDQNGTSIIETNGRIMIPSTTDRIEIEDPFYVVNSYLENVYYKDGIVFYRHEFDHSDSASYLNDVETVQVFSDGYQMKLRNNQFAIVNDAGDYIFKYGTFEDVIALGEDGALFNEEGTAIYQRFNSDEELVFGFIYEDGDIDRKDYISISDYSEGYAWAQKSEGRYDIVNSAGEVIESPNHTINSPSPFENGMALVYNSDYTKSTLIDTDGDLLTSFTYNSMGMFNGEGATASKTVQSSSKNKDYDYGIVNEDGDFNIISVASGIDAEPVGDYFIFKSGNKKGVADINGNVVLSAKYDELTSLSVLNEDIDFSNYNVFYARVGSYFGIIDEKGNEIIPIEHGYITVFDESDGVYCVQTETSTFFLNENDFSVVTELDFLSSGSHEGFFVFEEDGKWGLRRVSEAINDVTSSANAIFYQDEVDSSFLSIEQLEKIEDEQDAIEAIESAIDATIKETTEDKRTLPLLYTYIEEAMTLGSTIEQSSSSSTIDADDISRKTNNLIETKEHVEKLLEDNDLPLHRELQTTLRIYADNESSVRFKLDNPDSLIDVSNVEFMMNTGGVGMKTADIEDLSVIRVRLSYDDETLEVTLNEDADVMLTVDNTVAMMYDGSSEDNLAIYKENTVLGGNYNEFTKTLSAMTSGSGAYMIAANHKSFTDINYLPAEIRDAINALSSKGIINGVTSTEFAPEKSISRAEISALMIRMLNAKGNLDMNAFTDVTTSDWFYDTAMTATEIGLISGYEDNTFRGNNPINRGELIVMIARLAENNYDFTAPMAPYDLSMYKDGYTVATWAEQAVALCSELGIIVEQTDSMLDLSEEMTRAEAAVMLMRLFEMI